MRLNFYKFKIGYSCLLATLLIGLSARSSAQTVLSTTSTFSNNNGSGTVTFNLRNTNSSGIVITDVEGVTGSSGNVDVKVFYNPNPVNGAPGNIDAANGWVIVDSATITGVANTSSTTTQSFISNMNFVIPANTTYGIAIFATGQRYYSIPSAPPNDTITAGGVELIYGANVSYGGSTPPGAPTFTPRGWIGKLTFIPQLPCVSPPTPGTVVASATNVCTGGSVQFGLSGNSMGTGQTYQWESATTTSGPWTAISTPAPSPSLTTTATATMYYRAAVTCGTSTAYSDTVLVTVPAPFPAGTYTINSGAATGGSNFQSFGDAVSAISCGISGPVIFNVTPGSGPYNEQVIIPTSVGATATNTVTFNGNGEAISYTNTNSNLRGIVILDGADHITIDSLVINATGTTSSQYGFGIHLLNNADSNVISHCQVNVDTTLGSSNYAGIVISGSPSSATTSGSNCDGNLISGNTVDGGYYGFTMLTTTNNTIVNNTIKNYYYYGMYTSANSNTLIEGNDLSRPTRTGFSSFYGIYQTGATSNNKISKNRIHDPFAANPSTTSALYGIYLSSSDASAGSETDISNNILYNLQGSGTMYALYNVGSNFARYYYNAVAINDPASTSTGTTRGFYQTTSAQGLEFKNNIIYINKGGTGTTHGIYLGTSASVIASDHNDIFVTGGSSDYFGYSGGNQTSLPDWQTNAGLDSNSVSTDPIFASVATGNLTPGSSYLDNTGTPVAITTDITGAARSATTPDMGPYEFSVPPCFGTPTAGIASAPASICSGANFNLSLTGYTVASGITVQWEYLQAGVLWTPIPGATSPTYTVSGQTFQTDYHALVTCVNGGGSDISNTVTVAINPFINCYCTSTATSASYGDIWNVTLGALNNTSDCSTGNHMYTDFTTATQPNLPQSTSMPVSLTLGTCNTTGTVIAKVFIDLNQNGSFTDAGEDVFISSPVTSNASTGTIVSGNITIPPTATQGVTGMRVVLVRTSSATAVTPCGTYTYGETEDYHVNIAPPPSCFAPGTPTVNNLLANSATVDWIPSQSAPALGYEWRLFPIGQGPYGTPLSSGIETAGDTSAALTALTAVTDYSFYVRSLCSSIDTSVWASVNFTTPCSTYVAPFSQTFNSSTTPACWTNSGPELWLFSQGSGPGYGVAGATDHTGNGGYFAWVDGSGTGNNTNILLTSPLIDISGLTNAWLRYYVKSYDVNNTSGNNKLIVEALNGSTWVTVDSVQQNFPTNGWYERTALLNNITSSVTQLRFRVDEQGGVISGFTAFYNDILVDDIYVESAPSCIPPSNLAVSNITNTSASFTWNTVGGASSGYEYAVDQSNTLAPAGSTTITSTTTASGSVSSLTASNTYYLHVRANCGATNGYSAWVLASFSTPPPNDSCGAAINIGGGQSTAGTTVGATQSMPHGTCATSTSYANDVWYYFSVGSTLGTITVTATNTVGDVVLEVLSGTCGNFTQLDCQDSPAIGTETSTLSNLAAGIYYVRVYGYLSSQNPFTVQVTGTPLAVKLVDITASNYGTRNRIDWKTAEEDKGDLFIIERSADGKTFTELSAMKANGVASAYSYWDEHPVTGVNYYRLKMKESNGSFTYSKTVTANVKAAEGFNIKAYPNPLTDKINIDIDGSLGGNAKVVITDINGKVVRSEAATGTHIVIDMRSLASGVYILKYTDDNHTRAIKLDKQ